MTLVITRRVQDGNLPGCQLKAVVTFDSLTSPACTK
jgi:hypothetical protein